MSLWMSLTWVLSEKIHNAGVVDLAWTFGFLPIILIAYHCFNSDAPERKNLIADMYGFWSLRLTVHLTHRFMRDVSAEDVRYKQFRARFSGHESAFFFWFFQLQGVIIPLLCLPLFLAFANDQPGIKTVEWAGVAVWALAWIGESYADRTLRLFKADPTNKGKVCRNGLWKYSRHPNYFFEWLIWCGFFLFALGSAWGWTAISAPLLMFYILVKVTGIPELEKQSLISKGQAYADYQNEVSAFVPFLRRKKQLES